MVISLHLLLFFHGILVGNALFCPLMLVNSVPLPRYMYMIKNYLSAKIFAAACSAIAMIVP